MSRILLVIGVLLFSVGSHAALLDKETEKHKKSLSEMVAKEQLPVLKGDSVQNTPSVNGQLGRMAVGLAVALCLVAIAAFGFKALRSRQGVESSRKYLIEKVSYSNLGQKTGVWLLRVGKEFVLVGVTPNSVNMLTTMNELSQQYKDEEKFENETFSEAVQEEYRKLRVKGSMNA